MNKCNRFHQVCWLPLLLTVGGLSGLSGCATGPDYHRPQLSIPSAWQLSDEAQAQSSQVSNETISPSPSPSSQPQQQALPDWPVYFSDPRLQALIHQALEYNHDLKIATERIFEARALHGITSSGKWPEFELLGKREAALTPGDLNMTGKPLSAQRYDVGIELLNYEVDFWGRVKRLDEAALASYLATEEAQRTFRLSLIAEVANAYYTQCELHERLNVARVAAENRIEVAKLSDQRRQAGLMGSMEYLRAASAAEAARNDLAILEQATVASDHALLLLTGQMTASQPHRLPGALSLAAQNLNPLTPNLPAEVLLRRPDVLAAEQHLIAANANIGAARAAFLPRLTLTGLFSTASAGLSNLFDAGSRAWLFKPQLRVPIFNGGRNEANVDLAEARKNIAVAEYEKTIQQAFREVADLLTARSQLAEQLKAQQVNQKIQAERVQLYEARYKAQISHYLEVLDARRDLQMADQALLQTRRAVLSNAAQLYKALGGDAESHKQQVQTAGVTLTPTTVE